MPKRCAATAKKACGNYHNVVRRGAFRNVVTAKTLCKDYQNGVRFYQNGVRFYQYGVRLLPKRRAMTTESLWGDLCWRIIGNCRNVVRELLEPHQYFITDPSIFLSIFIWVVAAILAAKDYGTPSNLGCLCIIHSIASLCIQNMEALNSIGERVCWGMRRSFQIQYFITCIIGLDFDPFPFGRGSWVEKKRNRGGVIWGEGRGPTEPTCPVPGASPASDPQVVVDRYPAVSS